MNLLEQLREQRANIQSQIEAIVAGVESRGETNLKPDEQAKFAELRGQLVDKTDADGNVLEQGMDSRIADLVDVEARKQAAADAARKHPTVTVRSEPLTYERHGRENGYFRDLALATLRNDSDALGRLQRHAQEMDVEWRAREERKAVTAERELRNLPDAAEGFFEKRTNPNRTDGQGGYFVPPLWLVDEFIPLIRAGRVFANSVRQMNLPSGTDSINIPKVSTGTSTNVQTADAAGVTNQDWTDTFVSAPVRTIAGMSDNAIQLLDQSPINLADNVIFPDLLADYNRRVDIQCLSGTGANGQMKGLDNVSGVNAVTYTDASPTGPELYLPLAQAASQVAGNRLLPPTAYFFHTRRWFWLASQLDTQNRPLVVPTDNGPFNAEALQLGVAAEGPVGRTIGMPILMDPNITTTDNTNQDRIYSVRTSDIYLFEGQPRTRVLQEVLSGTLQIRFQLYNYTALIADRYPSSISIVSGTGLAAPSGF